MEEINVHVSRCPTPTYSLNIASGFPFLPLNAAPPRPIQPRGNSANPIKFAA